MYGVSFFELGYGIASGGCVMATNVIAGSLVVFGFTQTLLGARTARAALCAYAERVAKIFHGFGAVTHSCMNMPFGNGSANTDIHR